MSRLLLKPSSRSTSTSIQRPWQSNPFWYRWSKPRMARVPLVGVFVGAAPGVVDAHGVVRSDGTVHE